MENIFSRTSLILGDNKLHCLQKSRVVIFGLGGVGGYVAEALCRSGIGMLTLIDGDVYDPANLNRQIGAMTSTLGKYKTDAMALRLTDINHHCQIRKVSEFYVPGQDNANWFDEADFVADAIDDVPAKVDLLVYCFKNNIPVISSMGTGNKFDPLQLCLADISQTSVCPLARRMRQQLRRAGIEQGIQAVYSREAPVKIRTAQVGSMMFVPAAAGLLMAGYIVKKLTEEQRNDGQPIYE